MSLLSLLSPKKIPKIFSILDTILDAISPLLLFLRSCGSLSIMSAILQIVDESLRIKLNEELNRYVGRRVFTKHAHERKYYNIVGITSEPVKKLKIHRLSMTEFYWQRHRVYLSRPDLSAFQCDDTAMLPVELCYVADEGDLKVDNGLDDLRVADDEMEEGADEVEDEVSKMDVGGPHFSKIEKITKEKEEDVGVDENDGPDFSKIKKQEEEDVGIDEHDCSHIHKIEKNN